MARRYPAVQPSAGGPSPLCPAVGSEACYSGQLRGDILVGISESDQAVAAVELLSLNPLLCLFSFFWGISTLLTSQQQVALIVKHDDHLTLRS